MKGREGKAIRQRIRIEDHETITGQVKQIYPSYRLHYTMIKMSNDSVINTTCPMKISKEDYGHCPNSEIYGFMRLPMISAKTK